MVNNSPPPTSKPSRLSYTMFSLMAPYWRSALAAYPSAVEVHPGTLSVETFARKFREAREAWHAYKYTFNVPGMLKEGSKMPFNYDAVMSQVCASITTHMTDTGTLLLGPRDAIKAHKTAALNAKGWQVQRLAGRPGQEQDEVEVALDNIRVVISLIHENVFKPRPVNFVVRGLLPSVAEDLENMYPTCGLVEDEQEKGKWRIV